MRSRRAALLLLLSTAACSSAADEPLVEYPTPPGESTDPSAPGTSATPPGTTTPTPPPAAQPIVGTQLLTTSIFFHGTTSDGHLVFESDRDLVVLPLGATAPVTVVKDYDSSTDDFTVRGRHVVAWVSPDAHPSAITSWTAASGVVTNGPVVMRGAITSKPGTDVFAYKGPAASLLASKVYVTQPGQGAGTLVVANLDSGLSQSACKPTLGFVGSDLLVAGCTGGSTTPKVALYATDGTGTVKTILDGSAPGLWPDHARAHVLVQTASASEIRAVAGGTPASLDTPVRQALFSADDAKVVYLRADGKIRRASTKAPASPTDVATGASILDTTPDARFVVYASKVDTYAGRSDLLLVDAATPGAAPKVLATEKAIYYGLSKDAASLVYQTTGDLASGPLYLQPTSGGPATKLADDAERVVFDGQVVYWQVFDKATKSNILYAARLSAPTTPVEYGRGLDTLTSAGVRAGDKLYIGSKLGLWSYPALTP